MDGGRIQDALRRHNLASLFNVLELFPMLVSSLPVSSTRLCIHHLLHRGAWLTEDIVIDS